MDGFLNKEFKNKVKFVHQIRLKINQTLTKNLLKKLVWKLYWKKTSVKTLLNDKTLPLFQNNNLETKHAWFFQKTILK